MSVVTLKETEWHKHTKTNRHNTHTPYRFGFYKWVPGGSTKVERMEAREERVCVVYELLVRNTRRVSFFAFIICMFALIGGSELTMQLAGIDLTLTSLMITPVQRLPVRTKEIP